MPTSRRHVGPETPMGANLTAEKDGATFRVWAPGALEVCISGSFNDWSRSEEDRLVKDENGYWTGFVPGVKDGDLYQFHVIGKGSKGFKRDPYTRDLASDPPYPRCPCVVRDPHHYVWHDQNFIPPAAQDLILYQFHIGTFYGPHRERRTARFLDVLDRLDYLDALGVTAIQPLPVTDYAVPRSQEFAGSDLFAPEPDYYVEAGELDSYLRKVNFLLARKRLPLMAREQLEVPPNQLKVLIDLCHVYGLAVILDVVYGHAGVDSADQDEGLYFFDRAKRGNPNDSLYFTDQDSDGPVFAFWKHEVRQFLIDNASYFALEFHADGFRYDDAGAIVQTSTNGWRFCQDLTSTVRYLAPRDVQLAEYWPVNPAAARDRSERGVGFDAVWHDGLRDTVRQALAQAAHDESAPVDLQAVARCLALPGFPTGHSVVNYLESHDEVHDKPGRRPRLPAQADPVDHWSWRARSRSRVANGLLLTAPGIPMLFMGQEFLEDKPWTDDPALIPRGLLWWNGLESGRQPMLDHLKCMQDLIALRRRHPALRGGLAHPFHVHNASRVLAFHRWVEDFGRDLVIVASLSPTTLARYVLGFPLPGRWREDFNSDVYDHYPNPHVTGNSGQIVADGPPLDGMPVSARLIVPANGLLVFARDRGD